MSHFLLDGTPVPFAAGDTLMAAAQRAGQSIAHLCWDARLGPSGACRLCTVRVDGRLAAACTTHAQAGQVVENRTAELDARRLRLTQMLFVEGNHFCPGCEKSGDCDLQATAYALGMADMHFELLAPQRPVDASHPDLWLDHNRCILCKLCVRASHEADGKNVFAIGGYGASTRLLVNAPSGRLGDSALQASDLAARICPVGAILPKRRGFAVPLGARRYDSAAPPEAPASASGDRDDAH
ncbi:MAG: (2Fe-2S)-binding protein [Burkholderiales bacterium]|uniref:2Fe-2S iron-sulfur cluster-binding protein n=1 Tax=Comamonas granuli TaxID=290309 RepID=UPI0005A94F74|nr:2Fe-2S iron-sulfur cluster-binding protein [Comamonas granuli]MCZ2405217.1 (2Fe-2S)-binding protein [Burkholderiales bacterium]